MAFSKKKNKYKKLILLIIGLGLFILGSGFIVNKIFVSKINFYRNEIEVLNGSLKKRVLLPKKDIVAGTIINNENFYLDEISTSLSQSDLVTEAEFGKLTLVDVKKDLPLMKSMVVDEIIKKDIREEELSILLLGSNLIKNHFVDVRISFPNGEDYIVLSKKKIQEIDLSDNTIWLWLEEKEILTLSSAIVDAYINKGSKLYTVRYVAPSIQDESIYTYPVNQNVLKLIQESPNILEEAKEDLSRERREDLDKRIGLVSEEEALKVNEKISEEIGNRENKIIKNIEEDNLDLEGNGEEEYKDGEDFY